MHSIEAFAVGLTPTRSTRRPGTSRSRKPDCRKLDDGDLAPLLDGCPLFTARSGAQLENVFSECLWVGRRDWLQDASDPTRQLNKMVNQFKESLA